MVSCNAQLHSNHWEHETGDILVLNTETNLRQAEGDGPRVNTGMRLQGEHILVG